MIGFINDEGVKMEMDDNAIKYVKKIRSRMKIYFVTSLLLLLATVYFMVLWVSLVILIGSK